MNNLEDKIKKNLKDKKPKPKSAFITATIFKDIVIALIWIINVLLLGAVIYLLQSAPWSAFAMPGLIFPAILGLPWELIFIAIALTVILYFITKSISTLYRNKAALVIVLIISLFVGYLSAEATGLNRIISEAEAVRPLYQRQGQLIAPRRGPAVIGEIVDVESREKFTLEDLLKMKWHVIVSDETEIMANIERGVFVSVVGKKAGEEIKASIIRPVEDDRCILGCPQRSGPRGHMRHMY